MLKFLVVSSCLLAIAFGAGETTSESSSESTSTESTETSSETTVTTTTKAPAKSNYYQTVFSATIASLYVPFAIDQCSTSSSSTSIMPTCTDTTHVKVKTYSGTTCNGTALETTYNSSSPGVHFRCDGTNTYARVTLGVGGQCFLPFYAALDTCTQYSTSSTAYYSTFTCNSASRGYLKLFTTSTCPTAAVTYNFTDTCAVAFTISTYSVYGQIDACTATTTTTTAAATTTSSGSTTSSTTTSAANMIGLKNIVGIFVMIVACIIAKL